MRSHVSFRRHRLSGLSVFHGLPFNSKTIPPKGCRFSSGKGFAGWGEWSMRMNVICLMFAASMVIAAPDESSTIPNLSGVWTLDFAKSTLGPAAEIRPTAIEVSHNGSHLVVIKVVRGIDGKKLIRQQYTLDGRENAVPTPAGIAFVSARCIRKAIQIRSIQGNSQPLTIFEEWRVSQHGEELSIRRRAGRSVQHLVFRRSTEVSE